jgi:hypothetical protein
MIGGMVSNRRIYVVSVRDGSGPTTVEEVRTGRKARLETLGEAVGQIERWLRESIPEGRTDVRMNGEARPVTIRDDDLDR